MGEPARTMLTGIHARVFLGIMALAAKMVRKITLNFILMLKAHVGLLC
jgi:hypothetical protein